MTTTPRQTGVTWKHVLLLLACLVACGVLLVLMCVRPKQAPPSIIYDALERLIETDHVTSVDVAEITDFEWDYLYVFPPYTGEDKISAILGTEFVITEEERYRLNVGDVLIVFICDNKVAYYEFFFPKYQLLGADGSFKITREKAIFKIAAEATFSGGPYRLQQTGDGPSGKTGVIDAVDRAE